MTDELLMKILIRHLKTATENKEPFAKADAPYISAMREAVEKGSIGFAEWFLENGWEFFKYIGDKKYYHKIDINYYSQDVATAYPIESLYQEYLKSLEK